MGFASDTNSAQATTSAELSSDGALHNQNEHAETTVVDSTSCLVLASGKESTEGTNSKLKQLQESHIGYLQKLQALQKAKEVDRQQAEQNAARKRLLLRSKPPIRHQSFCFQN